MTDATTYPSLDEIDLIALDFDGVLTDNRVYVFEDGREAVVCNRSDGLGADALRLRGIPTIILSTEANPVVAARARKLRIPVEQALSDKAATLRKIADERKVSLQRVLYAGNDVNDLDAMLLVGWPVAPSDARVEIRAISRWVTDAAGGEGVLREIADRLLSQSPAKSPA